MASFIVYLLQINIDLINDFYVFAWIQENKQKNIDLEKAKWKK